MIEIHKPKLQFREGNDSNHAVFSLEPLEKGYGQTLGNAFRRVLLSSLPGTAVSAVKIDGVLHEFCSIPGIVEDVTAIVLNLKKLVVNLSSDQPLTLRMEVKGPAEVTAADIPEHPDLLVIDKDVHIAQITGDITFGMDITFTRGRGYVLAEENKTVADSPLGTIYVDSRYSPVERVYYNVEEDRVGQDINYDKLTLQVWTDGSMQPAEAVELASKFLRTHVDLFASVSEEIIRNDDQLPTHNEELIMASAVKPEPQPKGYLDIQIKDLEFSVRSRNCLKKFGINTLEDLVGKTVQELLEIKNFGKKSLKEVRDKLSQFNLTLKDDDEAAASLAAQGDDNEGAE
ncbi:MAG: DNA-directed RNA polymerase subunit alpha [Candidatus Riflebacteria bacterium]|nr:DNA-directed RNA polymerase subunit alpha [Candidatus Riflebacteria bacterium]